MRTSAIIVLTTLGVVLSGTAANAAPGDCLLLGPEGAKQLVCEPHPSTGPVLDSVCTDLEPAGNLPRRSCQSFVIATGELYGGPQIYTYAPENTLSAPVIPPYTPRAPYVAPAGNDESNDSTPLSPRPKPVVPAPRTPDPVEVEEPIAVPTPTPAPIDAAPVSPSPGRPAADADWLDTVDDHMPAVALVAFLVLVLALAWRPRTR